MTSIPSEDIASRKWDICLSNFIVNAGVGAACGIALSILIFKKHTWPIYMSTGFGMGMSYTECKFDFAHSSFASSYRQLFHNKKENTSENNVAPVNAVPSESKDNNSSSKQQ